MSSSPEHEVQRARDRLRWERESIERVRTRQFLLAQTTLLLIGSSLAGFAILTEAVGVLIFWQSVVFCGVTSLLTGLGWWWYLARGATTRLVVQLLYVDSVFGLMFFYVAGEFETPAMGILSLCLVMAPTYAGRKHVWGVALVQSVLYTALLIARQLDVLPYGYMVPRTIVTDPGFVVDSWSSFMLVTWGMAWLAGRASLDIMNSQAQLEEEVASKTQDLARARDALAETNARLVQGNQRLQDFNTAVSHDLRSPLQTIIGRAELLATRLARSGERAQRDAVSISDAAERMALQVDELLKLARLQDRLEAVEPVALDRLVAQVAEDLASRLRLADARLEVVRPLPTALGNPALLRELLQNLVENGIKYGSPDGPRVRIEAAEAAPGQVAIAIEDNGPGIPADDREHVFGLFRRLPRDEAHEGIGAGLAICRRILEVHDGHVSIGESTTLGGARFVVSLPTRRPGVTVAPRAVVH